MSRIAILGHGTRGDIQPILAVGDALRRRGHSVALTVNTNLAAWAERSGLEIVSMPPDTEAILRSPEGQRMLADGRATAFAQRVGAEEAAVNEAMTRACMRCAEGADLILSTVMTMIRACPIAEAHGIPHHVLLTMPVQPTSEHAMLLAPVRRFPIGWLNRRSYDVMLGLWWRSVAASQAETRSMLGLAPDPARPRVESLPSVALYSEALEPRPEDWSPVHRIAGFTTLSADLRRRLGELTPPDGLDAWLDAGPPPVFFGFGSLPVLDPAALLADVAEVTRRRGLRALVNAGWADFAPDALPDHVFIAPAFDHDRYFPRLRAAVHHGGAGTTAAALRAGLPTLVLSVYADQPFWGWRVAASGVGTTLPYRRLSARALDRALGQILAPAVATRAQALGEILRGERGEEAAADVIEGWLGLGSARSASAGAAAS